MSARTDLRTLRGHRVPAWWSDAKLGIFVHWTPSSVAGFAPVDSDIGDLLAAGSPEAMAETPYTEWYENSLRFPSSSASRHHRERFGLMPYAELADRFRAGLEVWDPDDWARRFAATGARYVVLVTKHHDGFCLWPSTVTNPHREGWHTGRDVVGELRDAVLAAGMRFGVYYSGGLDWTFDRRPIGNLGDMIAAIPRGDYPAYAEAQVRELIERYRPSVLWNDIAWPAEAAKLWPLLSHYYDAVPDGVVNDRWMPWSPLLRVAQNRTVRRGADLVNARVTRGNGGLIPPKPPFFDVQTPEYVVFDDVRRTPWECVRGMDQSFGYNRMSRPEHFLTADGLLDMTADIASKGGNLLLNVGPRGEDATIPDEQLGLLDALGYWTAGPGRSVFGSRPWVRATGEVTCADGRRVPVRFWSADRHVDVAVLGTVEGDVVVGGVVATPTTTVHLLDDRANPDDGVDPDDRADPVVLDRAAVPDGLRVTLPGPRDRPVIRLRDVDAAPTTYHPST